MNALGDSQIAAATAAQRLEAMGLNSLGLEGAPGDCRVVVAMSGGVDSSATAALLREQGYDVIGITLQLYDHGEAVKREGACCAGRDIHDARRVAEALDMPHYVLDYESRFREAVMEEFADSYLRGETPIPCVRCNESVKFRDLLDTARDLDARALVTGHYVRNVLGPGGWEMHRGADADRDQSYFLFSTTQEQLDFLRFPLGELSKDETRALARKLGVQVADKPDSQDICFVPQGRYTSVVERLRPGAIEPGEIVDLEGRVLGHHDGIIGFTVGQRRGLGVAVGEPLFVVRLEAETRRVVVGPRAALETGAIWLKQLNWLGDSPLEAAGAAGVPVLARVRSTRPPVPARVIADSVADSQTGAKVVLEQGEEGVAPGQACVFYDPADGGSRVLGGGWIESTQSLYDAAGQH